MNLTHTMNPARLYRQMERGGRQRACQLCM